MKLYGSPRRRRVISPDELKPIVELRKPAQTYVDLMDEPIWSTDIEGLQFLDGTFADVALVAASDSSILKCTNFDFSSIPNGSTIHGMVFYIDNYFDSDAAGVFDIDFAWTLVNAGADLGGFRFASTYIDDGTNNWQDGDGTSDFGYGLTVPIIKSPTFGYKFKCANTNAKPYHPNFDLIELGIWYRAP